MYTLVGDFGGTNCRLGLAQGARLLPDSLRSHLNVNFDGPAQVLRHYLDQMQGAQIQSVCFGAAGPVRNGRVELTNYPWVLSPQEVIGATGAANVLFLNDLQAQGYALHGLAASELVPILDGQAAPEAARLVVAIGTGVNAAVAYPQDGRIFVPPSESGHMVFGAADETDLKIAARLRADLGHCPIEAVLSGDGLARLWAFFGGPEGKTGRDMTIALQAGDPAAQRAAQRFASHLARYCADLALIYLPMGGIYLAGSVGIALADHLRGSDFAQAFRRPGPYQPILSAIPMCAVPNMPLTLRGCAIAAAQAV